MHTILTVYGKLLTCSLPPAFFTRPYGCSLRYDILRMNRFHSNYCTSQVVNIPKLSAEDTTLTTSNAAGEKLTIPVPKGTRLLIDTPGLHYNRENPFVGKVSRLIFITIFCSSLLEGSPFLQTCTLLGRLAKGCIRTV